MKYRKMKIENNKAKTKDWHNKVKQNFGMSVNIAVVDTAKNYIKLLNKKIEIDKLGLSCAKLSTA